MVFAWLRARLAALPSHMVLNPVGRDRQMKTADVEATYLSELLVMVRYVAKTALLDAILILLMIATIIL